MLMIDDNDNDQDDNAHNWTRYLRTYNMITMMLMMMMSLMTMLIRMIMITGKLLQKNHLTFGRHQVSEVVVRGEGDGYRVVQTRQRHLFQF